MGFLQKLSNLIATKIGVVISGDYKGVKVGFGTKEIKSAVSVGKTPSENAALLFFTKPETFRFNRDDIIAYNVHSTNSQSTTYQVTFKNGKKCLMQILSPYIKHVDNALFS